MNDFTKEDLQYFLMVMKPFHFLWKHDPLELENKIQSLIDNYCEHDKCPNCDLSTHPANVDCIKLGALDDNQ